MKNNYFNINYHSITAIKEKSMRILFCNVVVAVLFLAFSSKFSFAVDGQEQILSVQGVVSVQSDGSIMLDDGKKTERYNTGVKTVYEPSSYRTSVGDTVQVTYSISRKNSGEVYRPVNKISKIKSEYDDYKKVYNGKMSAINDRFFSSYKATIFLKVENEDTEYAFYVNSDTIFIKGKPLEEPIWYDNYVGQNATITVDRVPKGRGNGYVYVAKTVEMVDELKLAEEAIKSQANKKKMIADAAALLQAGAISKEEFDRIAAKILAQD